MSNCVRHLREWEPAFVVLVVLRCRGPPSCESEHGSLTSRSPSLHIVACLFVYIQAPLIVTPTSKNSSFPDGPTLEFHKDPRTPPFLVSTQDVDIRPDISILQTPPEYSQIWFCSFRFVYSACFACICEYAPHMCIV